ncbi:MAG: alanine--glyoxylate aminotransferase family protein [Thermoplasmatales archaeon]
MEKILMIPGPIEYESNVLNTLSLPTISHNSKEFILEYQSSLKNLLSIFGASQDALPFIISGSGTLSMEISTVNFISRNSKVLVVSTGYFGDRFATLLSRFTKNVEILRPPLGSAAEPKELYEIVSKNEYDVVTVTHVDTSTGVRNNIKEIANLIKETSSLLVVDAVCSAGGEHLRMDWGIDVAFSASQKALGAPPGLAVGVVGQRALRVMKSKDPLTYYSDLRNWEPTIRNTLDAKPSYFATPNVNLIRAFKVSLDSIIREGLDSRIRRHEIIGEAFRTAFKEMGLRLIADKSFANTVSAIYLPGNVELQKFLSSAEDRGFVFAGGLIEGISAKYFRVGHMGIIGSTEVLGAIDAIENSLKRNGYKVESGAAISVAQEVLAKL